MIDKPLEVWPSSLWKNLVCLIHPVDLVCLVRLVYLVDLVYLVSIDQPKNQTN